MRKITIFILIAILLILIGNLFFLLSKNYLTGKVIETNHYSYTKAICNETNYCQDYEIICQDKEVIAMTPITGANVQHLPNWKDSRNNANTFCE